MNREQIMKDLKSRHMILMQDGREIELPLDNPEEVKRVMEKVGNQELKAYVLSEEIKGQPKLEPPSIKVMQVHLG